MSYENQQQGNNKNGVYSIRLRAGKRRTYFFDVRTTRANDYFLTITESKRRFDDDGYDRHKIFLYKEDFNKFIKALGEATDYVKTELLPDYDFDEFNHEGQHETTIPSEESTGSSEDQNQSSESEDNSPAEVDADTTDSSKTDDDAEKDDSPSIDEQVEKW